MECLLDTHVWLWYLTGSERLPPRLRRRIDAGGRACWISPISVWEVGMLVDKGRIELSSDVRTWCETALDRWPFREAPITCQVALKSSELDLKHRDPADRLLAATAMVYRLTLLTLDQQLVQTDWLPTFSG